MRWSTYEVRMTRFLLPRRSHRDAYDTDMSPAPASDRVMEEPECSAILKETTLKSSVRSLLMISAAADLPGSVHNPLKHHSQITGPVCTQLLLMLKKKRILGTTEGSSRRLGKMPWAGRRRRCRKAPGVTPLEELQDGIWGHFFYAWPSVLVRNDREVSASHRVHWCLAKQKNRSSF